MADVGDELTRADKPRPLPPELRARLETVLTGDRSKRARLSEALAAAARPRPLPSRLRHRLEAALTAATTEPTPTHGRGRLVIAVAAAIVLVIGVAAVPLARRGDGGSVVASPAPGDRREPSSVGSLEPGPSGEVQSSTAASSLAQTSEGATTTTTTTDRRTSSGRAAVAAPAQAVRTAAAPITVAVAKGNVDQLAGFVAYIDDVNERGGVRGIPIKLEEADGQEPVEGAVATANLSGASITNAEGPPRWVTGPLLETTAATEPMLRDDVFSIASPIDRTAHLAADAMFPSSAPGSRAVIYYQPFVEPWSVTVPSALERVLRERNVTTVRVAFDPAARAFAPADVAFLSLPGELATRWLEEAGAAGYRPERGVAGIHSLHDEAMVAATPLPVTVLSPYDFPDARAAALIRDEVGRLAADPARARLSADAVHGWATAAALVEALGRATTLTGEGVAEAMRTLTGWQSGVCPAYAVRAGTNARTPEAGLFTVDDGRFRRHGEFRTDPY